MSICMGCGFVSYPKRYKSEDEIVKYYRTQYRKKPSVEHLFTGTRKLNYHEAFLREYFEAWKVNKKTKPVVADIGAAFGLFLRWVKLNFPEAEVGGTELTTGFRRVAFHEFGIALSEKFDASKKYDMIASYKVAEHQMDADQKLIQYKECLKEDGLLYISVPTWFDVLSNFGVEGFNLDEYYNPNHINVWSRKLFETMLKKCGLRVIKFNNTMYSETYMCIRDDSLMKGPFIYEDPNDIINRMKLIKQAWSLARESKYEEAIKTYPKYPQAYFGLWETTRSKAHQQNDEVTYKLLFEKYVKPYIDACPQDPDCLRLAADIAMRYDEFAEAVSLLHKAIMMRPNASNYLINMAQCYRQMYLREHDPKIKYKLIRESNSIYRHIMQVDPQHKNEVTRWIYANEAEIPIPNELQ